MFLIRAAKIPDIIYCEINIFYAEKVERSLWVAFFSIYITQMLVNGNNTSYYTQEQELIWIWLLIIKKRHATMQGTLSHLSTTDDGDKLFFMK